MVITRLDRFVEVNGSVVLKENQDGKLFVNCVEFFCCFLGPTASRCGDQLFTQSVLGEHSQSQGDCTGSPMGDKLSPTCHSPTQTDLLCNL